MSQCVVARPGPVNSGTKFKFVLLGTRNKHFIQKASRQWRWQTSGSKTHLLPAPIWAAFMQSRGVEEDVVGCCRLGDCTFGEGSKYTPGRVTQIAATRTADHWWRGTANGQAPPLLELPTASVHSTASWGKRWPSFWLPPELGWL